MKRKILYISIITLLIALSTAFYLYKTNTHDKCPDDYPQTDIGMAEYKKDMDKWTNYFFDSTPGATLSDWSKARYQFWVDNNCAAAIERYEDGIDNKNPSKMEVINNTLKETINEDIQ